MQFTDIETKIFNLLENTVNLLGFDLVKVNLVNDGGQKLKIIIDGKNEVKLTIDDCQIVSKAIAPVLDVEDPIRGKYLLEVSSSGVERPLVKISDYERFAGRYVEVRLHKAMDNRKVHKGLLDGVQDGRVVLRVDDECKTFDLKDIKAANLVLTDEMFRAILKN